MPDGSYPIRTAEDVENAVRDYDRSGKQPEVRAHIVARARAIGAESALPADWTAAGEGGRLRCDVIGARPRAGALAKAAAALADAAQKLERLLDADARLRKALDDVAPTVAELAEAGRGARGPAAAAQGGAASGRQERRRGGRRPAAPTTRSGASRRCQPRRGRSRSPSSA